MPRNPSWNRASTNDPMNNSSMSGQRITIAAVAVAECSDNTASGAHRTNPAKDPASSHRIRRR
jgi:hypothetical protein